MVAAFGWLSWPFWQLRTGLVSEFSEPSRLWEAPPRLERGDAVSLDQLVGDLEARGYRASGAEPSVGHYRRSGNELDVHLRSFPSARGMTTPVRLALQAPGGWLRSLRVDGTEVAQALYDPLLLHTWSDERLVDRTPVQIDHLPRHLLLSVLAAEDSGFFNHPGLSPTGIARAAWVNARSGEIDQGGSTLTQQLVKNLVLDHQRRWARKAREAVVAVLVELRFSKREILEAYLNEIFLGRSSGTNVIGFGAAAQVYFGVPASELSLAQAASLAGSIRSPASLSPHADPKACRMRRDQVLRRLHDLEWITEGQLEQALIEPLVAREPQRRRSRYAADAVAAELEERLGITRAQLPGAGLQVVTTLDAAEQRAAEAAVAQGLAGLEERKLASGQLQAALVSVEPRTGAVTSWVGGRDYGTSQFDRVRQAHRQVGSAFKPVVLAAALHEREVTVADRLLDEPLTVRSGGRNWRPQNNNRQFNGPVSVREAFERSLNVPTVRLALDVGLEKVIQHARSLGVESRLGNLPSLALGAFEMTPYELLRVYATFAAGGIRPQLHLVDGVLDSDGGSVGLPALASEPVMDDGVAYLVTSVLEGVVDDGTGRGLRRTGFQDVVAAKSGTSNAARDSWFVGYSRDRAALVWVGYDDGRATKLSGSRAALPIWGQFMQTVRPLGGFEVAQPPASVRSATIDPATGFLASSRCPERATESFLRGQVPGEVCWVHGGRRQGERRGLLRRLFGRRSRDSP